MLPERICTALVQAMVAHLQAPQEHVGLAATGTDNGHLYAAVWAGGELRVAQSHAIDDKARLLKLCAESNPVDLDQELGPYAERFRVLDGKRTLHRLGWRPHLGHAIA